MARGNQCPPKRTALGWEEKANPPLAAAVQGTAPASAALDEHTAAHLPPSSAKVQMILVSGNSSYSGG